MNIPTSAIYPRFMGEKIIKFVEKPVPKVGCGQLLIQSKANALCASDLGAYYHGADVTSGHEAAGIVVATGQETSTPVGTPGVIFLMDFCGKCRSCLQGFTNQCLAKRADYGFSNDGGYGPFMLVNENVFFAVDKNISLTEATLLLDIMGTGGHSISRGKLIHPDVQSLLVTGSGPIGLGILAMAKLIFGMDFPVLITDMVPYRLELAGKLGGLPINIKNESLQEGIKRHGFKEIDMAIDSTGKSSARKDALDNLAKRGVLVCVGHGEDLLLNISPDLIATERAIIGSEYFCYNEFQKNMELLNKNRDYLTQIITHRFNVSDIDEAFKIFINQNTGKVILEQ